MSTASATEAGPDRVLVAQATESLGSRLEVMLTLAVR